MKVGNYTPSDVSYSLAISSCAKGGGRWEKALELLREMESLGLAPNTITYNAAISCKCSQLVNLPTMLTKSM